MIGECLTISAADAAKIIGVTKLDVYRLAREGALPHRRFGRRLVFVPAEVRDFERQMKMAEEITAEEVASILGISRPTVYRMANRNELPIRKRGTRLYFPREEIMAIVNPTPQGDDSWMEK